MLKRADGKRIGMIHLTGLMAMILSALVLVSAFGVINDSAYAATSGDCGEQAGTVSFSIDGDGVMTITGTGSIKQQSKASNYPWYSDRAKVKKLIVEEGVTNVPNSSFNGMTNLKDVEFPSTLSTWGTSVFSSSSNIETINVAEGGSFSTENNILFSDNKTKLIYSAKNVTGDVILPSTLISIEANGLDGRNDITSITLPDGLETIGNYAFRGIKQVTSLTIPSSVNSIGTYAFTNMSGITNMEIPEGITTLNNNLFSGCSSLAEVTIPDTVKTIGTYVFQNCTSLETIEIPETVTSIGGNAFSGAVKLDGVTLPDGLTSLGASAFSGCSSLKEIRVPQGVKALGTESSSSIFLNCTSLEKAVLPEGLTTIGGSSFKGCTSLSSITIPDSVNVIGPMAFQQCSSLKEVTVPSGVAKLSGTFAGCTSLEKVTLPDTLTSMLQGGSGATMVGPFTGCESLEEISIPGSVSTIPKDCFSGCTKLKDIGLSEGTTSIGQNAYMNCKSLEDITIPKTVATVMGGAFENCTNLMRVRLEEGMTDFNTSNRSATTAFKGCDRLADIYIPDSLEGFQPITFEQADSIRDIHVSEDAKLAVKDNVLYDKDFTKLIYIPASYSGKLVLPETVVETGSRVAGYTHALTEIVFPEGFKTVGESAFYYADGLKRVTLPDTLETIGASGFRATGLDSIVIPDSVTSIGNYPFALCQNMRSAVIGKGLTQIPNNMFFNCYKLSDITLPDTVESIGSQAFSGIMVPEIVVPDGCKTIGATAFANNTNLNQVVLPDSLTSVPSSVFNGDTGLKYIYYKGTAEKWAALKCNPAYGTVITDYKGVDPDLDKAVIKTQPANSTYEKGETPEDLVVEVEPKGEENEQYFYTWYTNTTGEPEDGTTVPAELIENGSKCVPATDKIGTKYYYAVVTRMVNGYAAERTISDVAAVTVKMDLDGSGTEQDPFLVKTADDLMILYNTVKEGNTLSGVYIEMAADITLPDEWDPIGVLKEGETQSSQGKNVNPFSGVFDGAGHTITVPEGGKPLFGYVRNATIKNLGIYGSRIEGTGLVDHYERDYETGSSQSEFGSDAKYIVTIENVTLKAGTKTRESGLIGENNNSQDASSQNPVLIVSCKAEKGVEIGYDHNESQIGTFAGRVCGTIINCESYADVYGTERVGGIAGCQDVAMGVLHVINSKFHGTVNATGNMAGGIVGTGYRGSAPNALCVEIRNCHSDGVINGNDMVGGILGAEDEVAQCWPNGKGYINNNLFTGTINAEEGAKFVGGTVGYYRSLNKYTYFENNYYREGCGASNGFGGAQFVDTNADHEEESGIIYFNSENSVAGLPYVQFCDWKQGLNREDDPFGEDKNAISYNASSEELADPENILKKLNEHAASMRNWTMSDDGMPVIGEEAVCYSLELAGDYKTDYVIGEEFDTQGMEFKAAWTDGKVTEPSAEEITFTGFDPEKRGAQTVKAAYGAASVEFQVTVLKEASEEPIKVTFTMLGDEPHGDASPDIHTNKMGTLEVWIPAEEHVVDVNATCMDVLKKVLEEKGYTVKVSGNYVSGIIDPDGVELSEFTNGILSGWMYTLNGEHPQLMLPEQYLEDGDEIVFHYTDDYTFEQDALDVSDVKELQGIIAALPAADDLVPDDKAAIDDAMEKLEALKEANDKDKLLTSDEKAKLMELSEAIKEVIAEDDKNNAEESLNDALDKLREAEEAKAKADESMKEADEKSDITPGEAAEAALLASEDAEEALKKAEDAYKAADDAVKAAEKALESAYELGDPDAIEEAEEALMTAEEVRETADKNANSASRAARSAEKKADAALGKVKDDAIAEVEKYLDDNEGKLGDSDVAKAEAKALREIMNIKDAKDLDSIAKAVENAKKAIDDQVKAKEEADKKAEEAAKKAEEAARKKAEEDAAKKKAEEEAAKKAEDDVKKKAEEEAKKYADIDKITPSEAALKKAKADNKLKIDVKNIVTGAKMKKKAMTIKWKKVNGAANYKIAYRQAGKKWTEKWTKGKNKVTLNKLKKNGLYEFKLMAVKKSGSTWTKSKWSKVNYRFFANTRQKLTAKKKAISLKLKKVKKASGYDVLYALKKDMKNQKTKSVKGAKKTNAKVSGLKAKTTYFVKSRPYKKYKGHKYIGILNGVKKAKTK